MAALKHVIAFGLGVVACLTIAVIIAIGEAVLYENVNYNESLFDGEKWRHSANDNDRLRMIRDLEYYYISNGMADHELITLLGKPDIVSGDSIFHYAIGAPGVMAADQQLVFKLRNGVVKGFEIDK